MPKENQVYVKWLNILYWIINVNKFNKLLQNLDSEDSTHLSSWFLWSLFCMFGSLNREILIPGCVTLDIHLLVAVWRFDWHLRISFNKSFTYLVVSKESSCPLVLSIGLLKCSPNIPVSVFNGTEVFLKNKRAVTLLWL